MVGGALTSICPRSRRHWSCSPRCRLDRSTPRDTSLCTVTTAPSRSRTVPRRSCTPRQRCRTCRGHTGAVSSRWRECHLRCRTQAKPAKASLSRMGSTHSSYRTQSVQAPCWTSQHSSSRRCKALGATRNGEWMQGDMGYRHVVKAQADTIPLHSHHYVQAQADTIPLQSHHYVQAQADTIPLHSHHYRSPHLCTHCWTG